MFDAQKLGIIHSAPFCTLNITVLSFGTHLFTVLVHLDFDIVPLSDFYLSTALLSSK
jgi:hypothetical protein